MASENFVQPAIPHFDGHYDHWSMLMENFLRSKEYWHVVESSTTTLDNGAIDRSILETILGKETSKDIWDSMKKKYQGSSIMKCAQLQALRRDFETLQMKDGESITSYFAKTMEIANKMRFHGHKMEDVAVVEKILRSLAPKFDYVVCAIEESKDIDAFSLDELQSSLLVHEQKMNRNSSTEEQVLRAFTFTHSSNFKGRDRGRGRERGNPANISQSNGDGSKHFKVDDQQFQEHNEAETLLMVVQVNEEHNSDKWYMDTGCTNHMCGSKSFFSYLNEGFHSTVSFGDCSTVNVMGKGDIKIRTKNGFIETISNVFYVPDLKSNLLSAGQLQEKCYVITIQHGVCEIYDPCRGVIDVIQMSSNRLFPLKIESIECCLIAEEKSKAFGAFKSFKARMEKETEKTIKTLRTDRGGEYCSKEFDIFCDALGIRRELTIAYTPQQNGVSERKNKTILNMVTSLLTRGKIPKSF
ncbi:uncharacterized protein LOC107261771 [Ricinus communis]|uniref:uncharacterized protein LOC107261771 n=1 Tax=Ricinus communis TaxID=3988 RepID=UPI00201A344D|nr:uncharacterized protein LOC107261771 [Ricinus communis]